MIINRNMDKYTLQVKTRIQSTSGAWKDSWNDVKDIDVAIYPANYNILVTNNQKYAESTNTGLTTEKNIVEINNRLYDEPTKTVYEITFVNPIGKYTQLYLKKVVFSG